MRLLQSVFCLTIPILLSCSTSPSIDSTELKEPSSSKELDWLIQVQEFPKEKLTDDEILKLLQPSYTELKKDPEFDNSEESFDKGTPHVIKVQYFTQNDTLKAYVVLGFYKDIEVGANAGWCDAAVLIKQDQNWKVTDFHSQIGGYVRGGAHGQCRDIIQNSNTTLLATTEGSTYWGGVGGTTISISGIVKNQILSFGEFMTSWSYDSAYGAEVDCEVKYSFEKQGDSKTLILDFKNNLTNETQQKKYAFQDLKYAIEEWPFGNKVEF